VARAALRNLRIVASVVLMLAACQKADAPSKRSPDTVVVKSLEIGQTLPALTLATFSGDSQTVGGAQRQAVTLLNVWATWCGPCVAEFPALEALLQRYASRGLRVLAVSIDAGDAPVKAFLLLHPVTFRIGRDRAGIVPSALANSALPHNVLVAADGRVLYRAYSLEAPVSTALAAALDSALNGR
jgi:cytochrome c biogenesis protein CcmG, thiol:disulfide interchange protein DsbE